MVSIWQVSSHYKHDQCRGTSVRRKNGRQIRRLVSTCSFKSKEIDRAFHRKLFALQLDNENFARHFSGENCYHCMIINGRHENVIQYREGTFIAFEFINVKIKYKALSTEEISFKN